MIKISLINLIFLSLIIFIILSLSITHLNHPILTILLIIPYNLFIILNISSWKINFIYSIIIFIIIISGLLILFIYFTRLIANTPIHFKIRYFLFLLVFINILIIFNIFIYIKLNTHYLISPSKEILIIFNINNKPLTNIINLYTYPFNYITILSIIFLLTRLFSIIKLISTNSKPLRKP